MKLGKPLKHAARVLAFSSPSGNGLWEWVVGMPVVFGFLPETSMGHQYHLMNHLGWLQIRADGSLMAPHWTVSPPLIIHHAAFMNSKWAAVDDSRFFSNHSTPYICPVIFSVARRYQREGCSNSYSHWFACLLCKTRKQRACPQILRQ